MKEHGRLLLLKEKLMSYVPQSEKYNLKRLAQFQLKDFTRGNTEIESGLGSGEEISISSESAIDAMDYRQQVLCFPKAKLMQHGHDRIDEYVDKMKNGILNKDGIVPKEDKQNFNFFVNSCMNKPMI
jgi:hypothetical protein